MLFFIYFFRKKNENFIFPVFKLNSNILKLKSFKIPMVIIEFSLMIVPEEREISTYSYNQHLHKFFFEGKKGEKEILGKKKMQKGTTINFKFKNTFSEFFFIFFCYEINFWNKSNSLVNDSQISSFISLVRN